MTVILPASVDDAIAALASDRGAAVLAGGTDWMVGVNAGSPFPNTVVALARIEGLRRWSTDGVTVRLGAALTYRDLLQPALAPLIPGLAQAARTVGSPQIRNAGTLGGNLATASPAGDTLPVLVALEAEVELAGPAGLRIMSVEDFITGPKRTAIAPGELITAVVVPAARGPQEYLKVGVRNAMVVAVASLALVVDAAHRTVRVGLGSVGPVPLRARAAEDHLGAHLRWVGDRPSVDVAAAEHFAVLVGDAARPIDDHRSTARYRRHAISVLARRALRRVAAA